MLISYIIPVYNAEKFIEKCVHSILDQPVPKDTYEIILVNDGSRDDSHRICTELEEDHPPIKYFQKDNAGPGHSRNYGLDRSSGTYIWFIDADDYLEPGVAGQMVTELEEGLDLYIFGHRAVNQDGLEIRKEEYRTEKLSPVELLERGRYVNTVWCKLIRKKVLDRHKIRFREDIRGPEDFHFSFRLIAVADQIKTLDVIGYNYIENPASLMNTRSEEHMHKLGNDSITAVNDLRPFLNKMSGKKKANFQNWLGNFVYGLLLSFMRFKYSRRYVASALDLLEEHENYPVKVPSHNRKQRIFTSLSSSRSVFLMLIALKRGLGS